MKREKSLQFSDHINVLVKVTDGCNLRCTYCFHQAYGYSPKLLSPDTLESFCSAVFPHYSHVQIVWHGGEPTFCGLEYFRKLSSLVMNRAEEHGVELIQSMQTNGTLLTPEFNQYLVDNKIGVGLSYDGPVNGETRNSNEGFFRAKKLREDSGFRCGVISVISKYNIGSLRELYEHMKENDIDFQMNHYVAVPGADGDQLGVTYEEFVEAFRDLWEYWRNDEKCNISVEPFMRMIRDVLEDGTCICCGSSCLNSWICLGADGKITPCDRDFPEEYTYGYVSDMADIRDIYKSSGFQKMVAGAVERRRKCMAECDIYNLCRGGCNNNAILETGLTNNGGVSCRITHWIYSFIRKEIVDRDFFSPEKIANPRLRGLMKSAWRNLDKDKVREKLMHDVYGDMEKKAASE